ncbi:MAG TPA: S1/P1 nuclease [Burkholderiales bacterium]|nr:S1/P1 nuclease [Burkholderiales bacterium]
MIPRIVPALLAFALAQSASAWGPEGHRMVGDVAGRFLTEKTQTRILALLKADRMADGRLSGRHTLGEVASWADEIKDFEWGTRRGSWHYDDVPLCGAAEYAKYCRNGRCASAQLGRQIEILGNERARPGQRNEALKWVVHIVGDIHQPLHAANRGDRGGNRVRVSFFGQTDNPPYGSLNLHALWDVQMVQRLISDRGGEREIVSAPLVAGDRNTWERGSISDWVDESHRIARDIVYPLLPVAVSCAQKITDVLEIDSEYYAKAAPVIEIQIRKAGVRLARILNETLGR